MSSHAPFLPLNSHELLEEALDRSERESVALFKHSLTCGISTMARRRLTELGEPGDPPVYELIVQQSRDLSAELVRRFGIQHQSPQIILIHKKQAVFHASHGLISAEAIRNARP